MSDAHNDLESNSLHDRFYKVFATDHLPSIPDTAITAIVLGYNEAMRIPHFIDHHAKAGIGHFIYVDNGSTDETAELLDADERVTRIYTTQLYSEHKAVWRECLADIFCNGKWVVFLDVDELLVFPGWPEVSLQTYGDILVQQGADALFTTMVDMYPESPLSETQYTPGTPFLETAPYFDTGNYRLIPLEPNAQKLWPTPHYRVFGGARERLFPDTQEQSPRLLDKIVLKTVFGLGRRQLRPGPRRQKLDARATKFLGDNKPKLSPANMSKVPMLLWRKGTRFPGGPHRVSEAYTLADDWGSLLHFKYFDDFGSRSKEAVERGQHAAGAAHYKYYLRGLKNMQNNSPLFSGSCRFSSVQDLVRTGLMRIGKKTQNALSTIQKPD